MGARGGPDPGGQGAFGVGGAGAYGGGGQNVYGGSGAGALGRGGQGAFGVGGAGAYGGGGQSVYGGGSLSGGGGFSPGGGLPGGGPPGGKLGGGGGFVGNENPDLLDDIEPTPRRIVAIIEVGTGDVAFRQRLASWDQVENLIRSPLPVQVRHRWGLTQLFPSVKDDTMRHRLRRAQPWSSVAHSFTLRREKAQKSGQDKQKRLMELADWTLQHNLFKELTVVMNDLAEVNKELPAVVAYQKIQESLDKPVADNKDLRNWLSDKSLAGYRTEALPNGHYVLVHKLGNTSTDAQEIATRLRRLEDSFRSYYLWFALKSTDGKMPHDKNGKDLLTLPDQRLLALLITEDFEKKQKALYPFPLVHDGFYLRQANVAVFAGEPLDPMFKALKISNQDVHDSKIETLLKGRMSDVDKDRPYNEVMALLIAVMQDQAIVSTSTHEATRQADGGQRPPAAGGFGAALDPVRHGQLLRNAQGLALVHRHGAQPGLPARVSALGRGQEEEHQARRRTEESDHGLLLPHERKRQGPRRACQGTHVVVGADLLPRREPLARAAEVLPGVGQAAAQPGVRR